MNGKVYIFFLFNTIGISNFVGIHLKTKYRSCPSFNFFTQKRAKAVSKKFVVFSKTIWQHLYKQTFKNFTSVSPSVKDQQVVFSKK